MVEWALKDIKWFCFHKKDSLDNQGQKEYDLNKKRLDILYDLITLWKHEDGNGA
jgi:hypothetical protein